MTEAWNYFLVRTNTSDTGTVPGPAPATASPDIITWGTKDAPNDPAKYFTDNYSSYIDNELIVGQPNRIYVRAKNLNSAKQTGNMVLYWSKSAFLLWPTGENGWSNNIITTSSGQDSFPVSADPNGIVVSTNPFLWAPQPIYGDHYCLLGGVQDDTHPVVPTTDIQTINDLAKWVLNHRNVGWHNTRVTQTGSPQWSETQPFPGRKKGGKARIALTAKNCPVGWEVMFEFYQPDADNKICKLAWTRVDNDQEFGRFVDINIPENYNTQVFWGVRYNGIQPSKKWKVDVSVSYLTATTADVQGRRVDARRYGCLPVDAKAAIPVYDEVVIGGRSVSTG